VNQWNDQGNPQPCTPEGLFKAVCRDLMTACRQASEGIQRLSVTITMLQQRHNSDPTKRILINIPPRLGK
jgi:hypothetical protein